MKCWVGDEKVRDCRSRTLFVKTAELTVEKINIVRGLAFANGVQRLYFGAGRLNTNVKGFSKRVIEEIRSKLEPLYDIVIETSGAGLNAAMQLTDFAYVILRHEVQKIKRPQNKNRIWLKVDDGSFVGVAGAAKWNSLRDLDGDLYKTDKEVYK